MPGLDAAGGEAQPVSHIVQPQLQEHQQVVAGDAFDARGFLIGQLKLLFRQTVHALNLLLFSQLKAIIAHLAAAALAMLAGRKGAPFDSALVTIAAVTL
jgi:hypothetical protein